VTFTIYVRDPNNNQLTTGGLVFVGSCKTGSTAFDCVSDITIRDNNDGTYSVSYHPIDAGDHLVEVSLNKQPVAKSPYRVPIGENHTLASPFKSYAEGPGLETGNKNTKPAEFTIHAVTPDGKPKKKGGDLFDVIIEDPNGDLLKPEITDNGDGTYHVEYQPKLPGNYHVDVIQRNPAKPLYYDHLKNSPVDVKIDAGVDAANTIAYGPGLEPGNVDTEPAEFTIESRDINGLPIKEGGEDFVVDIDGPNGKVPAKVTDNGDGTYKVVYQPKDPGPHVINVTLDDIPIKDAPFHVDIKAGGSAKHTTLENFKFAIKVRDRHNNPLTAGGEDVKVNISAPRGGSVKANVTDNRNGTYTAAYELSDPGAYSIEVKLKGENVKGSPLTQIRT